MSGVKSNGEDVVSAKTTAVRERSEKGGSGQNVKQSRRGEVVQKR